jgi:hypothetical protein
LTRNSPFENYAARADKDSRAPQPGRKAARFRRSCGTLQIPCWFSLRTGWRPTMHGIIYLVGLIVVILAILSFFGLR